jgi:hypothetical protein
VNPALHQQVHIEVQLPAGESAAETVPFGSGAGSRKMPELLNLEMSGIIVNPGGIGDKNRIDLATSKNRPIPNARRLERSPEALRAAMEFILNGHPGRRIRSLTATYNCVGMALGSRRTCIDPEYIYMILKDDGYVEVPLKILSPGDLVLYHDGNELTHIAVVVSCEPSVAQSAFKITVLSQWGADGEYLHDYDDVTDILGRPYKFYSERRHTPLA